MEQGTGTNTWWRTCVFAVGSAWFYHLGSVGGWRSARLPPAERRETISLADAAIRALQHNLDISISRQTKNSRLADITVEQAKFDPTLSVNGQFNRTVSPLNRPVFGATNQDLTADYHLRSTHPVRHAGCHDKLTDRWQRRSEL